MRFTSTLAVTLALLFTTTAITQTAVDSFNYENIVKAYLKACNERSKPDFHAYCYRYSEQTEYYRQIYRTFIFRSVYDVEYELNAVSELEHSSFFENDTVRLSWGYYKINENAVLKEANRDNAYTTLNKEYDIDGENYRDKLNLLEKRTFVKYEYEDGLMHGIGNQHFLFIEPKNSEKCYLLPYDDKYTTTLLKFFSFDLILGAMHFTQNDCAVDSFNLNEMAEKVFVLLQKNDWETIYCTYGVTAEVLEAMPNYRYSGLVKKYEAQNRTLNELHERRAFLERHSRKIYRKLLDHEVELLNTHQIYAEDEGLSFCSNVIEFKQDGEYSFIEIICINTPLGWRIFTGIIWESYRTSVKEYTSTSSFRL